MLQLFSCNISIAVLYSSEGPLDTCQLEPFLRSVPSGLTLFHEKPHIGLGVGAASRVEPFSLTLFAEAGLLGPVRIFTVA